MTRTALRKQEPRAAASGAAPHYRLSDYPMHYLAAIQRQNQLNLTRVLRACALTVPLMRPSILASSAEPRWRGIQAALAHRVLAAQAAPPPRLTLTPERKP